MATVAQYVTAIRQREVVIARKLGADLTKADQQSRIMVAAINVMLAIIVKTLTDKGVIADADLNATLDLARDAAYDPEPAEPPTVPD